MRDRFFELTDVLAKSLKGDEVFLATFNGENSDFVRFNRSAVRQAGSVRQGYMTVDLIAGKRHAKTTFTVSGDPAEDRLRLSASLEGLRARLPHMPEDPYLLYSTDVRDGEMAGECRLRDSGEVVGKILEAGKGKDLAGIYAAGGIYAGFANSLGQKNWFATHSFHLDWTYYLRADKAVKSSYAGFEWNDDQFARKIARANEQLITLAVPSKTIPRGRYRVYLAPAALAEFVGILGWDGFGLKSHRTKTTTLLKMIADGAKLNPAVTLCENTADGIAPNFQSEGYVKPPCVAMIEKGEFRNCLVSPRSAREYGLPAGQITGGESPESLDLAAGDIPEAEVLHRLGEGLYINTLWYLNYSDRSACRITGMTRFATFWVENGQIAAPLNVMRFDETMYRALGENLIGLTRERDFLPSAGTYSARSTSSARMPGALINDFSFTL